MRNFLLLILSLLFTLNVFAADNKYTVPTELANILAPLNGKVLEAKTYGNNNSITVVHASVMGADHSDAYFIVAKDKIINIDDYANLSQLSINTQSNYSQFVQKFPNIGIWPGNHDFPKTEQLPGGVFQLIFNYQLLNGCHACELAGIANIGFNFDKDGNYLGIQLLSLSPSPIK